jgi:HEPN domain-containing protein
MPNRSDDWLRQSERDLEQAEASREAGRHEWACFAAHQAAEKAVKALHLRMGQEAWGHVVRELLTELPAQVTPPALLIEQARVLDSYYIPTRYPDSHPAGAPYEHYGVLQSEEAIGYAGAILAFVRAALAGS